MDLHDQRLCDHVDCKLQAELNGLSDQDLWIKHILSRDQMDLHDQMYDQMHN